MENPEKAKTAGHRQRPSAGPRETGTRVKAHEDPAGDEHALK